MNPEIRNPPHWVGTPDELAHIERFNASKPSVGMTNPVVWHFPDYLPDTSQTIEIQFTGDHDGDSVVTPGLRQARATQKHVPNGMSAMQLVTKRHMAAKILGAMVKFQTPSNT